MLCNHIAAVVCGGSANRLQRYEITLRHYVMSKTCGDIVGHYHGWKSRNNALEEACHKCSNLSLALAQLLFLSCCFIVSLYIRSLLCELMFVRPSDRLTYSLPACFGSIYDAWRFVYFFGCRFFLLLPIFHNFLFLLISK